MICGGVRMRVLWAAMFVAMTGPALAAPDCSQGPIPDAPVHGTVNGQPFVPQKATVQFTANGMSVNDAAFDRWALSIQTDSIFNALSLDMLVPHGQKPDGRVFRVLPTREISAQPHATEGTPEVQGWDLELESAEVDTGFTSDIASIRVELGTRKGDVLTGKIHMCVPSAKAEIAGTFSAEVR